MPRQKRQATYPSGYGIGNDSIGVIFYDKQEEVRLKSKGKIETPSNYLRAEIQLKKRRTVSRVLKTDYLPELFKMGMEDIDKKYSSFLSSQVFRTPEIQSTQLVLDFGDTIRAMKAMKETKRYWINDFVGLFSPDGIIEKFGSIDQFGEVLRQIGESRQTVNKVKKRLRESLHTKAMLFSKEHTVGGQYKEIYSKFIIAA